jgi:hypothetical protein
VPTRAGWAIIGLGAGTVLVGRLFGWLELYALGVGLAALVGIAVLMVRFRAFTLGVRRTVRRPASTSASARPSWRWPTAAG